MLEMGNAAAHPPRQMGWKMFTNVSPMPMCFGTVAAASSFLGQLYCKFAHALVARKS